MKDIYQKNGKRPLYKDLADLISKDILARGLKNGDFYCTMKSLCREFNASFITVRNAVAMLEQQGILVCRSAVGMCIQDIDKLKIINSFEKVILILSVHSLSNMHPFYSTRLISMMRVLTQEGFLPRVCDAGEIKSRDFETQASLADGIISSYHYYDMIKHSDSRIRKKPKVFFSPEPQEAPSKERTSFVSCDEKSLFDLCVQYLQKSSARHILYVHKAQSALPDILKKKFKSELSEYIYGVPPSIQRGVDIAPDVLKNPKDTFFLIDDDYVSIGIYQTALQYGINLIRENRILVMASPSFEITEQMGFPVVGFDPNQIGILAAKSLVQMIKNPGQRFDKMSTAKGNKNICRFS